MGGRKQSVNEGSGSRPLTILSHRETDRPIENKMTDGQHIPSTASSSVLPDGPKDSYNLNEISKVYSPLIGDAIRLLRIHSSVDETLGLKADLVHIPLSSAQLMNYKALSYTWGEEKASVSVTVNGGSILIRPNLDKILRTLRALEYEYVWVSIII
jgi:hypothetical protein